MAKKFKDTTIWHSIDCFPGHCLSRGVILSSGKELTQPGVFLLSPFAKLPELNDWFLKSLVNPNRLPVPLSFYH